MNWKQFMLTVLTIALLLSLNGRTVNLPKAQTSKTIMVPDDYPTINTAIGNAVAGDTIILRNGAYTEQTIQINQSLTLKSEYPNGAAINLHPPQYMVHGWYGTEIWLYNYSLVIQASNVNLLGLTINGGGGDIKGVGDQIQLTNVISESKIELVGNEDRIQNSSLGALTLTGSHSSLSESNFVSILMGGDSNLLCNCEAPLLQLTGSKNVVSGCSFIAPNANHYNGVGAQIILLSNATSNILFNNTVVASERGIELNPLANTIGASYNIFLGNKIEGAQLDGIWVWKNSSYNVFYGNLIANNVAPNSPGRPDLGNGISLGGSSDGVYYTLFFGNILKNNFHNFEAAHMYLGPVFFDNGAEGNYWDDYFSKCPNATEMDDTGTGSVPYPVGGNSAGNICDNHPLINEPTVSLAIPALPQPWASLLPTSLLSQVLLDFSDPTPFAASLAESASSLYIGGTVNFTATAEGGKEPYTYAWNVDNQTVENSTSPYYSTNSLTIAEHHVFVTVTDADNAKATTLTVAFDVLLNPNSSPSPSQTIEPTSLQSLGPVPRQDYILVIILTVAAVIAVVLVYFVRGRKQ